MSSMGKKTKSVVGSHTCWADSELSLTPVHNWHVVPFGRKKEELHKRNWGEIHLLLSALSAWRLWKQAGSASSLIIRPAETKVGRRETGRGVISKKSARLPGHRRPYKFPAKLALWYQTFCRSFPFVPLRVLAVLLYRPWPPTVRWRIWRGGALRVNAFPEQAPLGWRGSRRWRLAARQIALSQQALPHRYNLQVQSRRGTNSH